MGSGEEAPAAEIMLPYYSMRSTVLLMSVLLRQVYTSARVWPAVSARISVIIAESVLLQP